MPRPSSTSSSESHDSDSSVAAPCGRARELLLALLLCAANYAVVETFRYEQRTGPNGHRRLRSAPGGKRRRRRAQARLPREQRPAGLPRLHGLREGSSAGHRGRRERLQPGRAVRPSATRCWCPSSNCRTAPWWWYRWRAIPSSTPGLSSVRTSTRSSPTRRRCRLWDSTSTEAMPRSRSSSTRRASSRSTATALSRRSSCGNERRRQSPVGAGAPIGRPRARLPAR